MTAGALAVVPFELACEPKVHDDTLWVGEHLEYEAEGLADEHLGALCGGTFRYLDGYVASLSSRFGAAESARVHYVWVPDGVSTIGACASLSSPVGCADAGRVWSEEAVLEHELVHAVHRTLGTADTFVSEGLAEFYGGSEPVTITPQPERLQEAISNAAINGELSEWEYPTAGHFYSYVQTRLGIELAFQPELARGGLDLLDLIAAESGMTTEQMLVDYATYPITGRRGYRDASLSCPHADQLRCARGQPFSVSLDEQIECADEASVGTSFGHALRSYLVEIPVAGEYEFISDSSGADIEVRLEECAAGAERFQVLQVGAGSQTVVLDVGTHRVSARFHAASGPAHFGFSLRGLASSSDGAPACPD